MDVPALFDDTTYSTVVYRGEFTLKSPCVLKKSIPSGKRLHNYGKKETTCWVISTWEFQVSS